MRGRTAGCHGRLLVLSSVEGACPVYPEPSRGELRRGAAMPNAARRRRRPQGRLSSPSAESGAALHSLLATQGPPHSLLTSPSPPAILTPAARFHVRTSRCSDEPAGPESLKLSLLSKDGRSRTRKAISWPRRVYEGHPKSSEPQGTGRQSVFPCLAGH